MSYRTVLKLFVAGCSLLLLLFNTQTAFTTGRNQNQQLTQQALAIIREHCLHCHGAEKTSRLDLRSRESLLAGGTRGAAIIPGKAADSLLYKMISGAVDPRMPLGGALTDEQIATLKAWIDGGALWPEIVAPVPVSPAAAFRKDKELTDEQRSYWAFKKPVRPAIPQVRNAAWVRNPIDAFILAELEKNNLSPSPPADKRTLLRRVTLDLTGLPPTPDEINAFLADTSPDAYAKVVRRLLDSPRYGERQAQHWLDVVRFGETNGYELDQERKQAWRYRDYVIKAFNEDKPYDRFILEQLAGDELAPDNFEAHVATGFLRAGPQHVVSGNQDEAVNRQEWLTEAMLGTSSAFLGLTVGCARCHDHKFDPILQSDYYRLQAFFAATDNADFTNHSESQAAAFQEAMKAHNARLKPIKDKLAEIEKPYRERLIEEKRRALEPEYAAALAIPKDRRTPEQQTQARYAERMLDVKYEELLAVMPADAKQRRAALRREMHALQFEEPEPLPKALAVADKLNPVPTMYVLKLGDPHSPLRSVEPRFPSVMLPRDAPPAAEIPPLNNGAKSTGRRLALARWLASIDHPLTARVMVNRLWQHHFGRGIVATPNDFGRNGAPPTHPELLDWLAVELMSRGWSIKRMHELIVLSNAYQQASTVDAAKAKLDPDNKFFWRQNRQRLDAEAIRDAILAAAGTLTEQAGGPPVRVPLDPEVYETIFTEYEPDNLWPVTPDIKQHTRRSLYLFRKRNVRLPLLVAYDQPDLMSSCGARSVSVHALQSLTMMNSDVMQQQAQALARRLFTEAGSSEQKMIMRLYELALSRPPRPAETQAVQRFLKEHTALIRERIARRESVVQVPNPPRTVEAATAAAWVDLCLATLNLNEFVYVR
ncbi:MAG TPA: PSD1 and planctomycete cytochrome C domain-containing protein [Blastocatellia bacterium]|nr:PSD1 and planctomycete cytochrome C domain-containing protein [Blastocatellia bacterium]